MNGAGRRIRRVEVHSAHDIRLVDALIGPPGEGELLVRTSVVGICGSDVHAIAGEHPFIDLPYAPGHEAVGVVLEAGAGVTDPGGGSTVLVEPNLVCGTCRHCRSGRYNLCEHLQVFGCQTAGAMGDAFVIPATRVHRVPDEMSDVEAATVEPLSTVTHALRRAGGAAGQRIVVLGAGAIGLLLTATAHLDGAASVVTTDLLASKRERALALGASAAPDASDPGLVDRVRQHLGGPADIVFDCVSSQRSIDQAIGLAVSGGTVVVVGVPKGPVTIPLPLVQDREVRLEGSAMYVREDVERAMGILAAHAIPVTAIVTATYPLDRAADAFRAAADGSQVKVHVVPS